MCILCLGEKELLKWHEININLGFLLFYKNILTLYFVFQAA